ncbi:MAG: (d)CMP kinase [Myxococcales bacterium]|nr:MAG: (d)CMP kinase [Myxococcales bacterium]
MSTDIICIDGPAGSGKSTVARLTARKTGLAYLDTGALYRSLALSARREGIDWNDAPALARLAGQMDIRFDDAPDGQRVRLAGDDVSDAIRSPDISKGSSVVSRHAEVRRQLLALQREVAQRQSVVAEGRDTGNVVFPDAMLKIYLDASVEERARRRWKQLLAGDQAADFETVKAALVERDQADSERAVSPLAVAPDALVIDTTGMAPEAVVETIVALYEARRASRAV